MSRENMQSEQATNGKGKKRTLAILIFIILAISFAIAALIIDRNNRIMNNQLVLAGVSVNGVDLSELSKADAMTATAGIEQELLSNVNIVIDVEGEQHTYTASDLGVSTDYQDVMAQALSYGHTGTLQERKQAINTAKNEGVAFTVSLKADREAVAAVLMPLKEQLDIQPVDATCTFMPWGYTADGTAYEQKQAEMIEASASGKMWKRPELVRLTDTEMPNKLRYQYWQNTKYIKDYIPQDAGISRFLYTDEQAGRTVDMESVVNSVMEELASGRYAAVTAPVETLEPAVKLEDLKYDTQLVASWTSSYSNHASYSRNWNVTKLSGLINGVVIQPGEEWSINQHAGVRTVQSGWKEAPGIENGGYTQQAGGGVCQISSTLFNASIRSALTITDSTHHTISSDYIPLGLDATISSPRPDLKIQNPYDTPIYIISYVNPKDENVTVEIYGPPVIDDELGPVILNFSSESGGYYGSPSMIYYYNMSVAPDDTVIAPGQSYVFAKARKGQKVQTYIHYLDLEGNELKVNKDHYYEWPPINGKTYVNGPDPALMAAIPTLTP
jgi:vancomycin resistance protein YoaR